MQIFLFLVVTKNKTFHRKHHVIDMLYKFPFFKLIKCVTCLVFDDTLSRDINTTVRSWGKSYVPCLALCC